jgi:mannosyl-3-phosphoglycerate phosphatase
MTPPFIVFSDLDGCLLDRRTYSAEAARPAVEALADAGVPLVLCSS